MRGVRQIVMQMTQGGGLRYAEYVISDKGVDLLDVDKMFYSVLSLTRYGVHPTFDDLSCSMFSQLLRSLPFSFFCHIRRYIRCV